MKKQHDTSITILGAGSWGTALALLLADNNVFVRLWEFDKEQVKRLQQERCNKLYLPGYDFPDNIRVFGNLEEAISDTTTILVVVPSMVFGHVIKSIKPYFTRQSCLAWATKGLDPSGKLLHEVVEDELGIVPMAVVSGPSFAKEVCAKQPTAVVVASNQATFGKSLAFQLHNAYFRVYVDTDIIGVEISGAVKNVLAIAVGIADGLGLGANARSALITRGLAELTRLGEALGGKRETFVGLAGLGDLVLTCTDDQSRNRRFGLAIGQGETPKQAKEKIGQVVEGERNAKEVFALAESRKIEMPIVEQVYHVLYKETSPHQAVKNLLSRKLKDML